MTGVTVRYRVYNAHILYRAATGRPFGGKCVEAVSAFLKGAMADRMAKKYDAYTTVFYDVATSQNITNILVGLVIYRYGGNDLPGSTATAKEEVDARFTGERMTLARAPLLRSGKIVIELLGAELTWHWKRRPAPYFCSPQVRWRR